MERTVHEMFLTRLVNLQFQTNIEESNSPQRVLSKTDVDRDGKLSFEEFEQAYSPEILYRARRGINFQTVPHIFEKLDLNKDGFITINEIDSDATPNQIIVFNQNLHNIKN